VSHARNGGAVPRSRAMHRSVCRRRRVNLLERCCERTRTDRRRTLCERRRLRYAAAILLRQGGEIAPAPWRSRPDPSDVGALRRSFRRDHREPRHRATLSPTGGNEQAGRDEPLTPVSLLAIPFSRRCSSVRGPRRGAFSDDAFAPSFQGAATLLDPDPACLVARARFRESGNRPRSAFEQCPAPSPRANVRPIDFCQVQCATWLECEVPLFIPRHFPQPRIPRETWRVTLISFLPDYASRSYRCIPIIVAVCYELPGREFTRRDSFSPRNGGKEESED